MRHIIPFLWFLQFISVVTKAQPAFKVVPLGVKGGGDGSNLSAYMIAATASENYVCLDAGTLLNGIEKSVSGKVFQKPPEAVLRQNIKGYLISHAHLDHVSGLILNSIEDTNKVIYGLPKCIEILRNNYFNWESWPNFADAGNAPVLKKYRYQSLTTGTAIALENTLMTVKTFPLSHSSPYESAAFLIGSNGNYTLYFGDTGPDEVEKTDRIRQIWKEVAPLVKSGKLRGVFLEVSYPNDQADGKLFGHLTPVWFMKTFRELTKMTGDENVKGLKVVVTHIKPAGGNEQKIKTELTEANDLKLDLIFPEQGKAFDL